MARDDPAEFRDEYAYTFGEASAIAGIAESRLRSWMHRKVIPDVGYQHPQLGAWLFSPRDLVVLSTMIRVLALTGGEVHVARSLAIVAGMRVGVWDETAPQGYTLIAFTDIVGQLGIDIHEAGWTLDDEHPSHRAFAEKVSRGPCIVLPVDSIIADVFAEIRKVFNVKPVSA